MINIISNSVEDTVNLGKKFARELNNGDFVALYGDLGAGKTAFVNGITSVLIPDAYVHSPTYALVNVYENTDITICHFDMYRITDEDDLYSIGFYDYFGTNIIIVEWCENIPYALPEIYYKVEIEKLDENSRKIDIKKVDNT